MNMFFSIVAFCLVANVKASSSVEGRMSEEILNINQRSELMLSYNVPRSCPSVKDCTTECLLGYEKDQRGCAICDQCRTEGLFEGDIMINSQTYDTLLEQYGLKNADQTIQARAGSAVIDREWPKVNEHVQVPYTVDLGVELFQHVNIHTAIKEYQNKTCIRFVPRTNETNYIEFVDNGRCSSYVGMIGGKQNISITVACSYASILHEIMHALGFWHEQSRPDRDGYVTILWQNILPNFNRQFLKISNASWNSYGSPYDYNSVMHYPSQAFSINITALSTIVIRGTNATIPFAPGLSEQDLFQIKAKYRCDEPPLEIPCADTVPICSWLADLNFCQNFTGFRTTLCRMTCGECNASSNATTTEPPPTTTPATTDQCVDNNTFCFWFLETDSCDKVPEDFICQKSCGNCSTTNFTQDCVDISKHCNLHKKAGNCESAISIRTKYCKKTCGYCSNPTTEQLTTTQPTCYDRSVGCDWYLETGRCDSNIDVRTYTCQKTCAHCGFQAQECVDTSKNCAAHLKLGHCESLYYVRTEHCAKTCGKCTSTSMMGAMEDSDTKPMFEGNI